jgi:hypothetical protein
VDLAGSERVSKSNAAGARLQEAKHINLSLHYLEAVIVSLQQVGDGTAKQYPSSRLSSTNSPPSLPFLFLFLN